MHPGRGKLDRYKLRQLPVKDILLYPLARNFRQLLRGEVETAADEGGGT